MALASADLACSITLWQAAAWAHAHYSAAQGGDAVILGASGGNYEYGYDVDSAAAAERSSQSSNASAARAEAHVARLSHLRGSGALPAAGQLHERLQRHGSHFTAASGRSEVPWPDLPWLGLAWLGLA